jgi:preprotein translocase YajC subunit
MNKKRLLFYKFKIFIFLLKISLPFTPSFLLASDSSMSPFFWSKFFVGFSMMTMTYFLLSFPQRRRKQEFKKFLNSLSPGDTVLTHAGIVGQIESIQGNFVRLKFPSGYSLVVVKDSVAQMVATENFKN